MYIDSSFTALGLLVECMHKAHLIKENGSGIIRELCIKSYFFKCCRIDNSSVKGIFMFSQKP